MKSLRSLSHIGVRLNKILNSELGVSTIEYIGMSMVVLVLIASAMSFIGFNGGPLARAISDRMNNMVISLEGGSGGGLNIPIDNPQVGKPPVIIRPAIGIPEIVAETSGSESGDEAGVGEEIGWLGHLRGFFIGLVEQAWENVRGIGLMIWDGIRGFPITGDLYGLFDPVGRDEVRAKYRLLFDAFINDPVGTGKDMFLAWVEPIVTDWRDGRYGKAIGRATLEVALLVVPGDEAGKISQISRLDKFLPDELVAKLGQIDKLTPDELAALIARIDQLTPDEVANLLSKADSLSPEVANLLLKKLETFSPEEASAALRKLDQLPAPDGWQNAEKLLEKYLGAKKNTQKYRVEGMAQDRIPDFVTDSYIADAKFYSASTLSQSDQLRDFVVLAQAQGKPLYIYVREGTVVSQPALDLIQSTGGDVIRIFK